MLPFHHGRNYSLEKFNLKDSGLSSSDAAKGRSVVIKTEKLKFLIQNGKTQKFLPPFEFEKFGSQVYKLQSKKLEESDQLKENIYTYCHFRAPSKKGSTTITILH